MKGPELINMYVGQSEQNVRDGKYIIVTHISFEKSIFSHFYDVKVHGSVY